MKKSHILVLIGIVAIGLMAGLWEFAFRFTDCFQRIHEDIAKAKSAVCGCLSYRLQPASRGKYPNSLEELTLPLSGGKPFLEPSNVQDNSGKKFRSSIVVNERGEQEVYVWTEHVSSGKTYLCGAKGLADDTVVIFGLPE